MKEVLHLTTNAYDSVNVNSYSDLNLNKEPICYLSVNNNNCEMTKNEAFRLIEALKEAFEGK